MPPIYYLNPPPNPFWDFVAGMEHHPFFAQYQRPVPPNAPQNSARSGREQTQTQATAGAAANGAGEKPKGKHADKNVEDPPEVDPSTVHPQGSKEKDFSMPFRGRGRFANAFEADNVEDKDNKHGRHGKGRHGHRHHHGKGRRRSPSSSSSSSSSSSESDKGHRGGKWWRSHPDRASPWRGGPPFGPPPFMFAGRGGPFFGRHGPSPGFEGPEGHGPSHFGGPRGRGGCPRGRGGHHGPHGPHSRSPPHGAPFGPRQGPFGPGHGRGGFDLGNFLNNLGERIGVDLSSAAEGLGFKAPRANDADFEPRADIFDTASHYTIHLSLPGAKKSDVGVEWDGEHSVLRIAGVVHRPGVDEEMMTRLVVDGRKRETGVFEKNIRLGTQTEPAGVDVQGITAKMVDGVLVVRVPKVEKTFEHKSVHVSSSPEIPIERPEEVYENERDLLFDAEEQGEDEHMEEDAPLAATVPAQPYPAKASMSSASKGKQKEAEAERERERSTTLDYEHPNATVDTLPRYEAEDTSNHGRPDDADMSDWEKDGSEDEGEYVKINVD
ncbi:hypothetical protein LTS15_009617 [Exophiala xenobiotica]|nr:hypothetical protein LTS15_009617 [Exophiala xenobiotica]